MSNRSPTLKHNHKVSRLRWEIGVAVSCRLILNSARRFAYPFAPVLSRGLGVPLAAITSVIAVNQATAVIGMFFGPMADRWGYRLMMLVGIGMLTVGMFAGGIIPFYSVVLISLFLAGMGKSIFDPALQAYMGERVPFERRGLVIGVLEFSWAGSTLLGIPLIGILIEHFGWRAPFFAIGGLGILCFAALRILIPKEVKNPVKHKATTSPWNAWRKLGRERAALGAIFFAFFVSAANDNLFVVYGAWLEKSFDLSILALGLGTSVIGVAELSGEGLTAAISDRLGLKRSVVIGLIMCAISYIVLPLLDQTLPMAFGGLFFIFFTYEFMIVSSISLCTELMPEIRATMMSSLLAAAGTGRVVGALIGIPIWQAGGILMTGVVSAAITCLGLLCLVIGLRGWRPQ